MPRTHDIPPIFKNQKFNIQDLICLQETITSLNEAIKLAGGIPRHDLQNLNSISALELMIILSPNNIRFRYNDPNPT